MDFQTEGGVVDTQKVEVKVITKKEVVEVNWILTGMRKTEEDIKIGATAGGGVGAGRDPLKGAGQEREQGGRNADTAPGAARRAALRPADLAAGPGQDLRVDEAMAGQPGGGVDADLARGPRLADADPLRGPQPGAEPPVTYRREPGLDNKHQGRRVEDRP